jgi:hypothetical protein
MAGRAGANDQETAVVEARWRGTIKALRRRCIRLAGVRVEVVGSTGMCIVAPPNGRILPTVYFSFVQRYLLQYRFLVGTKRTRTIVGSL